MQCNYEVEIKQFRLVALDPIKLFWDRVTSIAKFP